MKSIYLLIPLLAACVTSSEVYTPIGTKGHSINCGGVNVWNADSWQGCYEKASELCGDSGYEVFEKDEQGDKRQLLIACRS